MDHGARYWMWAAAARGRWGAPAGSGLVESWEEQAFARDAAAGDLGGYVWPPRSYSCSFCRREFRSAQALGGHMNVHRRDRARLRQSSSSPSSEDQDAAGAAAAPAAPQDDHPPTPPAAAITAGETTMVKIASTAQREKDHGYPSSYHVAPILYTAFPNPSSIAAAALPPRVSSTAPSCFLSSVLRKSSASLEHQAAAAAPVILAARNVPVVDLGYGLPEPAAKRRRVEPPALSLLLAVDRPDHHDHQKKKQKTGSPTCSFTAAHEELDLELRLGTARS